MINEKAEGFYERNEKEESNNKWWDIEEDSFGNLSSQKKGKDDIWKNGKSIWIVSNTWQEPYSSFPFDETFFHKRESSLFSIVLPFTKWE